MRKISILLALSALCFNSYAQGDDFYNLSLEELMEISVNVSKTDLKIRETPSVISVITRDEIRNMGARDLMDVLNQIPGFNFGIDVQNAVGLGVRGNWAHEGKVLLLMDGQEMNEILFSTTQFGQHYDINNIDKIEIIRGPGSSVYGGYAELGVINIITRNGEQLNGIRADAQYGITGNTTARANVSLAAGKKYEKFDYSISGLYGQGIRSDQTYTDIYGSSVDFTNNSSLRPMMINAGINYGKLSARLLFDNYQVQTIDQFDAISVRPDLLTYQQLFSEIKYELEVSEKFSLTPRINYKTGKPWNTTVDPVNDYNIVATRLSPSINANWIPSDKISVIAGVDSYFDEARHTGNDPNYFSAFTNDNTLSFYNIGVFTQAIFKTKLFIITLGSRLDSHNQFGEAFSPRVGLTKAYDKLHFKALYSRAFRAPALENLNYNPSLIPERTGVAELELGYKITNRIFLTGNLFHIQIDEPIVYFVDPNSSIGDYGNFGKAGSMGLEIDLRIKYDWGYINSNYAYYTANNINQVALYQIPTTEKQVLGMPGHRFNLNSHFKLGTNFSINPSLNLIGSRYGINNFDNNDNAIYTQLDPEFFFNLFLRYRKDKFDAGLGVYDIINQRQQFVQPYNGGHAIMPGIGREFAVRVGYLVSW